MSATQPSAAQYSTAHARQKNDARDVNRCTMYVTACVWSGCATNSAAATNASGRLRRRHSDAVRNGVRYFSRMRLRYRHGGQRDYVFRWAVLPGATIPGWNGGPSA